MFSFYSLCPPTCYNQEQGEPSGNHSIIPRDFPFLFTLWLVCPRNSCGYATKSSEKEYSLTKLLIPLCSQAQKLTASLLKHRLNL